HWGLRPIRRVEPVVGHLGLESETVSITKVAVMETVEEFEAGDGVEAVRNRRHRSDLYVVHEAQLRNSNLDCIDIEPAFEGAAQTYLPFEHAFGFHAIMFR